MRLKFKHTSQVENFMLDSRRCQAPSYVLWKDRAKIEKRDTPRVNR